MSVRSIRATLPVVACVIGTLACSIEPPLERRNPFDPDGIFEIQITGPDSAHYVGQVLQFALTSDPALPDDVPIDWFVLDDISDGAGRPLESTRVLSGNDGTFVVRTASARYRRQTAMGRLGEVQFGQSFWLGQKVMDVDFLCGVGLPPAASCAVPFDPLAPVITLPLAMRDAADAAVGEIAYAIARATISSSDPTVVQYTPIGELPSTLRLTVLKQGSAWIRMQVDEAIDSVRVDVVP